MGKLTPNVPLVYERVNGVTYARQAGTDPGTREEVGWNYDPRTSDGRPLRDHIMDDQLWHDIRREAQSNPGLHKALERAKIIYYLSKENKEYVQHHPV